MKSIYEYINYKDFLKDYYDEKKDKQPNFSYGVWSRSLGLKTTASLTMIINGSRHPGKTIKEKIYSYLKLSVDEISYFDDLILLSKSEEKDISLHLNILKKIKSKNHRNYMVLSEKIFNQIGQWYYFALREMTKLKDCRNDPDWIRNHLFFDVEKEKIKNAIAELKNLGIIKEDINGNLIATSCGLNTYDDLPSKSIKSFHHQMIDHAKSAIDLIDVKDRYVSGLTVPVNSKNINKVKAFIKEMENQILNTFEEDFVDSVYQMNIQFFPLTKKGSSS